MGSTPKSRYGLPAVANRRQWENTGNAHAPAS